MAEQRHSRYSATYGGEGPKRTLESSNRKMKPYDEKQHNQRKNTQIFIYIK
jgi:hypothetical protein